MESGEKRIEVVELKASEINTNFGNPRKIKSKKRQELEESLETFGDFGILVIDEHNNIISGNQRLAAMRKKDPDAKVLCKRLIGYTDAEKRAINIKANTHAGEWDLDLLADWTADLNLDFGIDPKEQDVKDRKINDMELIRYEKYDYVMIVCKNEVDYLNLIRILGIDGKKVLMAKKRRIKARAVWYDSISSQIIEKKPDGGNK